MSEGSSRFLRKREGHIIVKTSKKVKKGEENRVGKESCSFLTPVLSLFALFIIQVKYHSHPVVSYLKMTPSLAMEYSILGSGSRDPSIDDVIAHRAPIETTYLAQGAPFIANTSDNVTGSVS